MSDKGRSPSKLLVIALALPIFALVYVTTFASRLWAALRPAVAMFLGATVISSVYAETAYRKTPTPVRAAAVVALAVALVFPSFSAPAPVAAADPTDAVIAAAQHYLGHRYRMGGEGPQFDCSGLIYRAFSDAGELPRIGGMRLRAAGYMQYFVSRGRFTKDDSQAQRGDLVVYDKGEHIGIYLGNGKVISALVNPWGVSIHSLHGVHLKVSYFLHVNWGGGDSGDSNTGGNPNGNGNGNGNGNTGDNTDNGNGGNTGNGNDNPTVGNTGSDNSGNSIGGPSVAVGGNTVTTAGNGDGDNNGADKTPSEGVTGSASGAYALGTMNLRTSADPGARIIGWIGKGGSFKVIGQGTSPAGFAWFQVQTKSGKVGWVYSRWVKESN